MGVVQTKQGLMQRHFEINKIDLIWIDFYLI